MQRQRWPQGTQACVRCASRQTTHRGSSSSPSSAASSFDDGGASIAGGIGANGGASIAALNTAAGARAAAAFTTRPRRLPAPRRPWPVPLARPSVGPQSKHSGESTTVLDPDDLGRPTDARVAKATINSTVASSSPEGYNSCPPPPWPSASAAIAPRKPVWSSNRKPASRSWSRALRSAASR